jgi:anti-sigma B factor antagonist
VITLEKETLDDATVVRCGGRLVAGTTEILRAEVKRLIVPGSRVILDFSGTHANGQHGAGQRGRAVCFGQKCGRSTGLTNLAPKIRLLFSMTNLLSLFESAGDGTVRLP